MKQFLILSLVLCLSAAVFSSCNNEDNTPEAPSISFKDNTDGTFYAKAGFPLTLTPQVENGDGAQYSWTLGGQQVGTSATYTFQSDETGTYALTLTVKTAGGEATQQLSVTVEPVDVHYRQIGTAWRPAMPYTNTPRPRASSSTNPNPASRMKTPRKRPAPMRSNEWGKAHMFRWADSAVT